MTQRNELRQSLNDQAFVDFIEEMKNTEQRMPDEKELAEHFGVSKGKILDALDRNSIKKTRIVQAQNHDGPKWNYDPDRVGEEYEFPINKGDTIRYVSEATMEYICQAYPHRGLGLNAQQIAAEVDIPEEELRQILSLYRFRKTSPPVTLNDLKNREIKDIVDESLEARVHKFDKEYLKAEVPKLNSELRKTKAQLREFRNNVDLFKDIIEDLDLSSFEIPAPIEIPEDHPFNSNNNGILADFHVPVADLHLGSLIDGNELWGNDYNVQVACERLVRHAHEAARVIAESPYEADNVYLTDIGDFFHALSGETEHGTLLTQDDVPKRTADLAFKAKIAQINALRSVCRKVVVLGVQGNHDHLFHWFFMNWIEQAFSNVEDVEVRVTPKTQAYFIVGETSHVLDHGYRIGAVGTDKAKTSVEVALRQVLGSDFYKVHNHVYYVGHLHNYSVGESGNHLEIIRLPAFTECDEYSQRYYFSNNPRGFVYRLDELGRLASMDRIYLNDYSDQTPLMDTEAIGVTV